MDSPALAEAIVAQKSAHPDQEGLLSEIADFTERKLYHQLTEALLKYLRSPPFAKPSPVVASELNDFFNKFVRNFESKFDKVRWVEILSVVCLPQEPSAALDIIAPFEAGVEKHRDGKYMWQALKAEKLTMSGRHSDAQELLDSLEIEIDRAYEVDARIQSKFRKTQALLWKNMGRPHDFYKSSILYLAYTPLEEIPEEERPQVAFEVGVASLVAPEEFNFGELLQQDVLASLSGSKYEWLMDLLQAFGEARFDMYDAALSKHRAVIDQTAELKAAEAPVLKPKMAALALMELAFRKPKKQRSITFAEIAQHCRVGPKEVEHLVMKAMCEKLICGKVNEVESLVDVTWVKPRILDRTRIDLMRKRVDELAQKTGLLLDHLEDLTPELLVS